MSLLETFAKTGALLTIATTHHGELKTLKYRFATSQSWKFFLLVEFHLTLGSQGKKSHCRLSFMLIVGQFWNSTSRLKSQFFDSNDAFENACMEFDEVNLKPTYKILWGVPGFH